MSVDRSITYGSSEACHGPRLKGIKLEFIGVKRKTIAGGVVTKLQLTQCFSNEKKKQRFKGKGQMQCTYWTDFLAGVGELTCQAKIKHIAASAGTG